MILLILDRDGTIIEDVGFLGKEENWEHQVKIKEKTIKLIKGIIQKYNNIEIIVFTNQTGVARGFFTEDKVKIINKYIDKILREKYKIYIKAWMYTPNVDKEYAKQNPWMYFKKKYIKKRSYRKPDPYLIKQYIKKNHKKYNNFIVIGDKKEDEELAKNLKAKFIDANKI